MMTGFKFREPAGGEETTGLSGSSSPVTLKPTVRTRGLLGVFMLRGARSDACEAGGSRARKRNACIRCRHRVLRAGFGGAAALHGAAPAEMMQAACGEALRGRC
jgi:hypothetical protein